MELMLPPPKARYGIVNMTLPGHAEKYVEIGPVLAASYNRLEFEVLYPFRAVVKPLEWQILEAYGFMDSPDAALWKYMKDKRVAELVLSQDFDKLYGEPRYGGDGAVALEPPDTLPVEDEELLALEVGT